MKRFVFFACLIIGIGAIAIAQENEAVPRFSLGGGAFLSNSSMESGGSMDFAFLVFHRNIWDIRNHLVFRSGGFQEGGIMMLSEKVSVGGMIAGDWRSYGYVEGGVGVTSNKTKSFFEKPIAFSFGCGGGTDIFLTKTLSIYFEAGGLFFVSDGRWNNGSIFQIGWKGWF